MSLYTPDRPIRLSTGVFTDEELDYFDSLGPDYFPSEETHPVGESSWHYLSIKLAFELLERVFPEPSDVLISANQFIYWDRQQKGLVTGPDLFVVKGVGRRPRSVYKTWEEGDKTPDVVFEFASEETWRNDLSDKKTLFEKTLRISEYFLFDPMEGLYPEKLLGYRLIGGVYQRIEMQSGHLYSEELELELLVSGRYLRFFDPKLGELIPTAAEIELARRKAELARQQEAEARQQAELEVARLRAELVALRNRVTQ